MKAQGQEKVTTEAGGRDQSGVSTSQGVPQTGSNPRGREEGLGTDSPLELSETARPCQHLDSGLPTFRITSEYISIVLSHSICGTFLTVASGNTT